MDATSSTWDAAAPLLHPLLRPERAWPAISMFAMCLAFFSRDADARAVAADALIEGILDGRAQPELLGKTLAEFSWHSWANLNRLGEALQNVGRVSNWAALVVATMLETFIAEWQDVPRYAHHLLSLLLDLLTSLKRSPTETTIGKLVSLVGKSKTAVIAARLAGLQSVHDPSVSQRALLEAVQIRIDRAHRCLKWLTLFRRRRWSPAFRLLRFGLQVASIATARTQAKAFTPTIHHFGDRSKCQQIRIKCIVGGDSPRHSALKFWSTEKHTANRGTVHPIMKATIRHTT